MPRRERGTLLSSSLFLTRSLVLVSICHVNDILTCADASQAEGEREEDEDGGGEVGGLAFNGEGYRAKKYVRFEI